MLLAAFDAFLRDVHTGDRGATGSPAGRSGVSGPRDVVPTRRNG